MREPITLHSCPRGHGMSLFMSVRTAEHVEIKNGEHDAICRPFRLSKARGNCCLTARQHVVKEREKKRGEHESKGRRDRKEARGRKPKPKATPPAKETEQRDKEQPLGAGKNREKATAREVQFHFFAMLNLHL